MQLQDQWPDVLRLSRQLAYLPKGSGGGMLPMALASLASRLKVEANTLMLSQPAADSYQPHESVLISRMHEIRDVRALGIEAALPHRAYG